MENKLVIASVDSFYNTSYHEQNSFQVCYQFKCEMNADNNITNAYFKHEKIPEQLWKDRLKCWTLLKLKLY